MFQSSGLEVVVVAMLIVATIALIVILMGLYTLISGKPNLLHDYHRATTAPNDLPRLARWSGAGLVLIGMGIMPLSFFAMASTTNPLPGWAPWWSGNLAILVVAIVLMVCGYAMTFGSIVRFNGSLFS